MADTLWTRLKNVFAPAADEETTPDTHSQPDDNDDGQIQLGFDAEEYDDLLGLGGGRIPAYRQIAQVERDHPQAKAALDVYASLGATGSAVEPERRLDKKGKLRRSSSVYNVRLDGGVGQDLMDEASRRTKLPSQAWPILRKIVRDGDAAKELVYNGAGMKRLLDMDMSRLYRREKDGVLAPDYPFRYNRDDDKSVLLRRWQVAHWRAGTPDSGYGYMNGLIYPLLRPARELALMNTALVLARLTDPDGRLAVYVDTGDLTGEARKEYLRGVKAEYMQTRRVSRSGKILVDQNPVRQGEPIFIGVSSARPLSKIVKLPAGGGIRNITDIRYHEDRFLAGLAVSKAAYGMSVPYAARGAVDAQLRLLHKTVRHFRQDFENTAAEIYMWTLLSWGVSYDWLSGREMIFEWPSLGHEDDILRLTLQLLRLQVASIMRDKGWIPSDAAMLLYLGFDHEQVAWLKSKGYPKEPDLGDGGAGEDPSIPSPPSSSSPIILPTANIGDALGLSMGHPTLGDDEAKAALDKIIGSNERIEELLHNVHLSTQDVLYGHSSKVAMPRLYVD